MPSSQCIGTRPAPAKPPHPKVQGPPLRGPNTPSPLYRARRPNRRPSRGEAFQGYSVEAPRALSHIGSSGTAPTRRHDVLHPRPPRQPDRHASSRLTLPTQPCPERSYLLVVRRSPMGSSMPPPHIYPQRAHCLSGSDPLKPRCALWGSEPGTTNPVATDRETLSRPPVAGPGVPGRSERPLPRQGSCASYSAACRVETSRP